MLFEKTIPGTFVVPNANAKSPQVELTLTVPVVLAILACGLNMVNSPLVLTVCFGLPFVKIKSHC